MRERNGCVCVCEQPSGQLRNNVMEKGGSREKLSLIVFFSLNRRDRLPPERLQRLAQRLDALAVDVTVGLADAAGAIVCVCVCVGGKRRE